MRSYTVRIAFVIPYFYPAMGYGGTPRLAYEMARTLTQRGHEVAVFTTDAGGQERISEEVIQTIQNNGLHGMRVHFYKNLSNALAYRQRIFLPTDFFREVRAVLQSCQIIHIHDLRSFLAVAAHRAARSLSIPYVLSPHGGLPHLGKESAKVMFDFLWGRAILRDAAALCAISPLEEDDAKILGIAPERIHPFPPAINTANHTNLPARGIFSSRWGLEDRRIVLFLGRLHWIKGADLLIEAANLLPELTDLHLVIAGPDDGAGDQLRSLVKARGVENKVTFTGFLDGPDKLSALVDSEVVVIPSRREGFPLTLLEALASQKPVILTSACDLGGWVHEQSSVVSFRSGDSGDLAHKLKAMLCSAINRNGTIEIRNFVLNEFSLDALGARAERLYESVISP